MALDGTITWNELLSADPDAAMRFYQTVLGWSFEPFAWEGPSYWLIKRGEALVGGLGGLEGGDAPSSETYWLTSIEVADLDQRFEQAVTLGARPVRPPHAVPGIGRVAVLRDPTGGLVCWMQSEAGTA